MIAMIDIGIVSTVFKQRHLNYLIYLTGINSYLFNAVMFFNNIKPN